MENGLPITFVTGIHTGCTKYYVKGDSPITDLTQLRGKKIGVPGLADSSVMHIKRKLADLGVGVTTDNLEVEFVVYKSSDLPIALDKGAVDAIGLHDPVATKFVQEYCCQAFVTLKLANENPKGAAAYARAMQKASAYVREDPRGAAQFQLDNKFVTGDLDFNAKLIGSYNFQPSRKLGKETFIKAATQLQSIGILKSTTDIQKFLARGYTDLKGVPDGYTYDPVTKTFTAFE